MGGDGVGIGEVDRDRGGRIEVGGENRGSD